MPGGAPTADSDLEAALWNPSQSPKLKETPHKIPHFKESLESHVYSKLLILNGRQGGARTRNPQLRRLMLYPIELLAHAFLL